MTSTISKEHQAEQSKTLAINHIFALEKFSFNIPSDSEKFFKETKLSSRYKYWTSQGNGIDVHKKYININKPSAENIKLALNIATLKLKKIHLDGTDEFVNATIDIIARDQRYANISLSYPEYQKKLDSRRLDIEIEPDLDLDLDSIHDLDISNAQTATDSPVIVNRKIVTLAEKIKQLEEKTKELKKKERAKKQAELRKKQKRELAAFLTKVNKLIKQIGNNDIVFAALFSTLELVQSGDPAKINQLIALSKKSCTLGS